MYFLCDFKVLSAVEVLEGSCNSSQALYLGVLKASTDQEKVGQIELQPDEFDINVELIPDYDYGDYGKDVLDAIKDHYELRSQFFKNASEALVAVTRDVIITDLNAIYYVRKYADSFKDPIRLAEACSMAEIVQNRTDEYVDYAHKQYVKFKDDVLPKPDGINDVLEILKNCAENEECSKDLDKYFEMASHNVRKINDKTLKEVYTQKDIFLDAVYSKALEVDNAYAEMFEKLIAQRCGLHTPELKPIGAENIGAQ